MQRLVLRLVLLGLRGYQHLVSPWLPRACRFAPSCSEYARLAIATHGLATGTRLAVRRLLRCHPWHLGGYDPVPGALETMGASREDGVRSNG
jgi:uncharacterized protein